MVTIPGSHICPELIHDKHFIPLKKKSHLLTAELRGTTLEPTSEKDIGEQIQIFSVTTCLDSPPLPVLNSTQWTEASSVKST